LREGAAFCIHAQLAIPRAPTARTGLPRSNPPSGKHLRPAPGTLADVGPQILLDKSALQSLSYDEAFRLGDYVLVVVPPVLMAEIQADLTLASHKKKSKRAEARNQAAELAKKLHGMFSRGLNQPHRLIVLQDLAGYRVVPDGRPIVGGTHVVTDDGQRGFWVADAQEKALAAWSVGDFSPVDKVSAQEWRHAISDIDLNRTRERLLGMPLLRGRDLPGTAEGLVERVDTILGTLPAQEPPLAALIDFARADPASRAAILRRWERAPEKRLAVFAPYAHYCARVLLLFHFALVAKLIDAKRTNRIDLEYLYYVPFAKAFASGDTVHAVLAPLVFDQGRPFISRDALKEDAKHLLAETERLIAEGVKRPIRYPPERPGSPVLALWQEHMLPREEIERERPKMTPEQEAEILKRISAMSKARPQR
jgi:hypothetical protein